MFVMGVNNDKYTKDMKVVSNASCTTNCLAPLAYVLEKELGIIQALMSTIHASTSKQKTVDDRGGGDWRTGRSVYNNIIPTSTGAAKAVGKVIPELAGKITGTSFRVPAADVSLVDLTLQFRCDTTYQQIVDIITRASETYMKGIIAVTHDEVVSSDLVGSYTPCVFDVNAGVTLDEDFFKLIAWYDNEWGYTNMVCELVKYMYGVDNA